MPQVWFDQRAKLAFLWLRDDVVAKQIDRQRAPKHDERAAEGLRGIQIAKGAIGGLATGLLGIGLLLWEIEEGPSFWGILRSVLIAAFGFGLMVVAWRRF